MKTLKAILAVSKHSNWNICTVSYSGNQYLSLETSPSFLRLNLKFEKFSSISQESKRFFQKAFCKSVCRFKALYDDVIKTRFSSNFFFLFFALFITKTDSAWSNEYFLFWNFYSSTLLWKVIEFWSTQKIHFMAKSTNLRTIFKNRLHSVKAEVKTFNLIYNMYPLH